MMRALVLSGLILAATPALAANAPLQQAQKKYKELDYQPMPGLLAEALLQPGLSPADYVEIYRLQGFTYTVLGDVQKARDAYLKLLIIDPGHQLEKGVSPRFRGAFEETKKDFETRGAVTLTHVQPVVSGPSDGFDVEYRLHDEFGRVAAGAARVRAIVGGREGGFVNVALQSAGPRTGDRVFRGRLPDPTASIPGERPSGYFLEYEAAFTNPVGAPVTVGGAVTSWKLTVGDPNAAPAVVAAPPPAAPAASGQPVAQDEPASSKLPFILAGVGGVAAVGLLGVVILAAGGAAAGAGGAACYFLGPCGPEDPTYAKVHVVVSR